MPTFHEAFEEKRSVDCHLVLTNQIKVSSGAGENMKIYGQGLPST